MINYKELKFINSRDKEQLAEEVNAHLQEMERNGAEIVSVTSHTDTWHVYYGITFKAEKIQTEPIELT